MEAKVENNRIGLTSTNTLPEKSIKKETGGQEFYCEEGKRMQVQMPNTESKYAFSTWTIGSTDTNIARNKLVNNHVASVHSLPSSPNSSVSNRGLHENSHLLAPNQINNDHTPQTFTAGINANDYVPTTLSSLSNMGNEGVQCRQQYTHIGKSMYQDRLLNQHGNAVGAVLAATCETIGFDIAEVWLRTGHKTHQLINSHLRPAALENSVRNDLVGVYYGERSSERTHRLSPALCKRAKEAKDVVWVTTQTEKGAETLRISINDVRTAIAVPVCHESSNTNITFIYFSMKRTKMSLAAVEFLIHMSLSAAVSSVNPLSRELFLQSETCERLKTSNAHLKTYDLNENHGLAKSSHRRKSKQSMVSVTGADLNLKWSVLKNVEYLTDGGNSWIHTAVYNGKPCVVKTLKPECQDVGLAINEIEDELAIHSRLDHPNIVSLCGAGLTSKGVRFVVLERLDGGTLTQLLGYDTRIRDRRRRFWRKKQRSYTESLTHAKNIANALEYLHERAVPGSMCLHRDLKPDNIGFTLDGTVKLIDFGLATILNNASPQSDEVYEMSGETGSLRYMAPEVADSRPYNHKADVYSFAVILWELLALKRPYDGMTREAYYERVVYGGERPPIPKKWPTELANLISACWSSDIATRPSFPDITATIENILRSENKVGVKKKIVSLIDRHSTWF